MAVTVTHTKVSTIPDDADTSLIRPSDWNATHTLSGVGTMATQDANAVAITGGTISGVTIPASNITGTLTVPYGGTGATTLTGYVKGAGTTALSASSTIPNTDITGLGTASTKDAGSALGVATLDSAGKVPISQIPDSVIGALSYQGTWDASTNTPTLTSSVGTKGYYYVVSVAGSTNLNGITDWQIGDWAVYSGTAWQKIDNTDGVTSVNGYTGAVVLTQTDISGTVPTSRTITAGTGLTGGGDLSANRTFAIDSTVATLTGTQTLTNKTLTTPVIAQINDANGNAELKFLAIASAVNQVTIENASTGNPVHIYATGTDASIGIHLAPKGASGYINVQGGVDSTKRFMFNPDGGTTSTRTMLSTSQTVDRTLTLPDATDTLVGKATTDTLTNKSISGSTNTLSNISNASLTNSAITINGTSTSLGGSISVGTVTSVTGTAPVVSSGGNTPAISMAAATTSVNGYLTSADWTTFNNKGSGTVTSVAALTLGTTGTDLSSTVATGTTTPVITLQVPTASASNRGALSSTDWTTFNGKQATLVSGTNIKTINGSTILGSGDLTVTGTPAGSTTQVQYNNAGAFGASAGLVYNSTTSVLDVSASTGAIYPPSGTTAQRPSSPASGAMRFNTTTNQFEVYSATAWVGLTTASYTVSYLSVAGGGGGGGNTAGGGGAGGFLTASLTFVPSTVYTITVGSGGSYGATVANGSNGNNSVISGSNITTVTSTGGGGGAGYAGSSVNGVAGGSGGGATGGGTGGSGTSGQGSAGGTSGGSSTTHAGGGGGGATGVGGTGTASTIGGAGGAGTASSITGSSVTYAGGGGGGVYATSSQASGGAGGGGSGGASGIAGVNGTANTGGGGGGGGSSAIAGNGGSGVVILSMPTANYSGTTTGSPTVTTSGSNKILTFTSSGTYTA